MYSLQDVRRPGWALVSFTLSRMALKNSENARKADSDCSAKSQCR